MLKIPLGIAVVLWCALLKLPTFYGYFLRWLDLRKVPSRKIRHASLMALGLVIFVDLYLFLAASFLCAGHIALA